MLELERQRHGFKTREVWFSQHPFDVTGYHCVEFYAVRSKVELAGFEMQSSSTLVIDLTQELDTIWKSMSKTSARNSIKRAEKAGVNVRLNSNYEEFQDILSSLMRAKQLPPAPLSIDVLQRGGPLFVAEHDGEIISGIAYVADDDIMRLRVFGSKRLEVDRKRATLIGNANRLLIWEAIQHAKQAGIREFDLGVYYTGESDVDKARISAFKRSFGGELVPDYFYTKTYSKTYQLAKLAERWIG